MEQSTSTDNNTIRTGKERRQHTRHPVSFQVTINIESLGQQVAQAKDYCSGGLLLEFEQPLSCVDCSELNGKLSLITIHLNGEDYRLRARIVHADPETTGVSFINPDQIALQAIVKFAKIDETDRTDYPEHSSNKPERPAFSNSKILTLVSGCNSKVQDFMSTFLTKLLTQIQDDLFNIAKITDDTEKQNIYFQSLESFDHHKNIFINTYSNSVNKTLKKITTLEFKRENKEESLNSESLALISDVDFNSWLANSKVINKVETENSQKLGEIETRLSHVCEKQVDRGNNPYSPALFVQIFEHALDALELKNETIAICYDALKQTLLETTPGLYTEINQTLIDSGILPTSKEVLAEARKTRQSEVEDEDLSRTSENCDSDEKNEIEDTSSEKSDNPDNENNNAELVTIEKQNLYDLVGEIRALQEQIKHSESPLPQDTQPAISPSQRNNIPTFSAEEVIDIISNLKIPAQNVTGDGSTLSLFRNNLSSTLASTTPEFEGKILSQKQNQVLDTAENVFSSLLSDMQVAHSIRPWIEKLSIPILKMSLIDDTVITNKNHVVRDVINKISELEVLASTEDEEEQAAVNQAFNWIVNLVNKEFDGTSSAYERAAKQLDILINVQQQAFEKNIKQVVEEAIIQEREPEEAPTEGKEDVSITEDDKRWLKMVKRLDEGHWVLFEVFSDEPKRLKVAWVAPRKGKYVFVNVMGRKDRILTDIKLAELFKDGHAVVLDGSDDPAMDRAQYSMLQNLHKQLLYQSSHDDLTGLINRREFIVSMQHALDDSMVTSNKHAICYIDIDNFKAINDSYGFEAGDKLIKEFVTLMKNNIEENNILARINADNFAVLIQNISTDDAIEKIEDLQDALSDYRFNWQESNTSVTISAGIAIINKATNNMTDLFCSVETSCGHAKEMGGNQIQIHHAGSSRSSKRKQESEWVTKIDMAIEEQNLFLRCQKIHPIQQNLYGQTHYEILLGLSDELGGTQNLQTFIQAAEHHNKMINVDRWVIKTAFDWLSTNEDLVSDISAFTINLSGQSLNSDHLVEYIDEQIGQTAVPIEKVCFEITETAGVNKLSDAADFIETIKQSGCQFALDDFGSGMSSYSYLKNLPVDYLKIDGAFVKEITTNQNDYAVVKSITEIAHFMGKTVIAEFVQDDAAIMLLKEIGVDYAQGFGIARPHALSELLE